MVQGQCDALAVVLEEGDLGSRPDRCNGLLQLTLHLVDLCTVRDEGIDLDGCVEPQRQQSGVVAEERDRLTLRA